MRACAWAWGGMGMGDENLISPYEALIPEGHKLGFVRVLARLGRTTSDQQWRLRGLRVCDTRMASIRTNVDCAQPVAADVSRVKLRVLQEGTED